MNFPCRSTPSILRPASAFVVLRGVPIRTRRPVNSELMIFLPIMAGRSVRTTVSTSGSSGNWHVHQNAFFFQLDGKSWNAPGLIHQTPAARGIEFPHVPRTNQHSLQDSSLPQRTTLMRANPGESAQFAADIADGIEITVMLHFDDGVLRQFAGTR